MCAMLAEDRSQLLDLRIQSGVVPARAGLGVNLHQTRRHGHAGRDPTNKDIRLRPPRKDWRRALNR